MPAPASRRRSRRSRRTPRSSSTTRRFDHYFITRPPRRSTRSTRGAPRLDAHRPRVRGVSESASGGVRRQPGLPLLHSAAARRLALLLGVDRRVRGRSSTRSPSIPTTAATSTNRRTRSTSRCPTSTTGACPADTVPVYRLWNQRADSNHRYTTDPGIKAAMLAKGYVAEGYGPDAAAMCTTAAVLVDALTRVVRARRRSRRVATACPRSASCTSTPKSSRTIAVNPANPNNFIGVWQQDRWSNGGARGPGTAYSLDGGGTWTRTSAPMSRCTGGNAAQRRQLRARDRSVGRRSRRTAPRTRSALALQQPAERRQRDPRRALDRRRPHVEQSRQRSAATTRKTRTTRSRSPPIPPTRATSTRCGTGSPATTGPTWFARTIDGGATWEPARNIYDPGANSQTLNNQIVVLPDGTLDRCSSPSSPTSAGRIRGCASCARPTRARRGRRRSRSATCRPLGTVDPETGHRHPRRLDPRRHRGGHRTATLAVTWQDSRFSAGAYDDIAFSRSQDGGLTWSAPMRINGDPAVRRAHPDRRHPRRRHHRRHLLRLPQQHGRPGDAADRLLARDVERRRRRGRSARIAGPFDYATAPLVGGRYFLGDYMGLASVGTTFLPFFGQTTGDPSNRSDIVAALARASAAALAGEAMTVKAAIAAPGPMTPDVAHRVDAMRGESCLARAGARGGPPQPD